MDYDFSLDYGSWNASVWTSKNKTEEELLSRMKEWLDEHRYGNRKATRFKIYPEYNEPTDGNWEFTILYM